VQLYRPLGTASAAKQTGKAEATFSEWPNLADAVKYNFTYMVRSA